VAKVGGGPALGAHAGGLAQLERRLERDAHEVTAPDGDELAGVAERLGRAVGRAAIGQQLLDDAGETVQVVLAPGHRSERLGDERHDDQLGGEGLRRRHGGFVAGPERELDVGRDRQRARGIVRDRHGPRAAAAVALQHRRDLRRATRLAYPEREPAVEPRLGSVERHQARRG
jgi:hypothetical protein